MQSSGLLKSGQSQGVQPTQRRSANKSSRTAQAPHTPHTPNLSREIHPAAVDSLMEHRRRMKESQSTNHLNQVSSSTEQNLDTSEPQVSAIDSLRAGVPRLNLQADSLIGRHYSSTASQNMQSQQINEGCDAAKRVRAAHILSQERSPAPYERRADAYQHESKRQGRSKQKASPQQQLYQPRFHSKNKGSRSGGRLNLSDLEQVSLSQVQFTPLQAPQHHPRSASKEQTGLGSNLNLSKQQICESGGQDGLGKVNSTEKLDSFRLPQFNQSRKNENSLVDSSGKMPQLKARQGHQGKTHWRDFDQDDSRDEILDNSLSASSQNYRQEEPVVHNQVEKQRKSTRVPRQERLKRRQQQALSNTTTTLQATPSQDPALQTPLSSQTSPPKPKKAVRASAQLQSLLQQTSLKASQQIESIENERLLKTNAAQGAGPGGRSQSRSSRKPRGRMGQGTDKSREQWQTPLAAAASELETTPTSIFAVRKTSFQAPLTSTSAYHTAGPQSQYPKFDIDLASLKDNDHQRVAPPDDEGLMMEFDQPPSGQQQSQEVVAGRKVMVGDSEVRVNKFGAGSRFDRRRVSDSRSNMSLSITRHNKDATNTASETLNKLVLDSVQNLSKILQRPGTTTLEQQPSHSQQQHALQNHQLFSSSDCSGHRRRSGSREQSNDRNNNRVSQPMAESQSSSSYMKLVQPSPTNQRAGDLPYTIHGGTQGGPPQTKVRSFTTSAIIQQRPKQTPTSLYYEAAVSETIHAAGSNGGHQDGEVVIGEDVGKTTGEAQSLEDNDEKPPSSRRYFNGHRHSLQLVTSNPQPQTQPQHPRRTTINLAASSTGSKVPQTQAAAAHKDLSIIAESDQATSKAGDFPHMVAAAGLTQQQPDTPSKQTQSNQTASQVQDQRKTYMSMTATASARKTAIQGSQQTFQQRKQRERALLKSKSGVAITQASGARPNRGTSKSFASVDLRSPVVIEATQRIVKALRINTMWARLRRLASLRARLDGVIRGQRLRRYVQMTGTRTLIKEIQLMKRRELRQPTNYLRQQQRKKIRVAMTQLVDGCDQATHSSSVGGSTGLDDLQIAGKSPQKSDRIPGKQASGSSGGGGSMLSARRATSTLFKPKGMNTDLDLTSGTSTLPTHYRGGQHSNRQAQTPKSSSQATVVVKQATSTATTAAVSTKKPNVRTAFGKTISKSISLAEGKSLTSQPTREVTRKEPQYAASQLKEASNEVQLRLRSQTARQESRQATHQAAQSTKHSNTLNQVDLDQQATSSRNGTNRSEYTSTLRKATKSYQMKIAQQQSISQSTASVSKPLNPKTPAKNTTTTQSVINLASGAKRQAPHQTSTADQGKPLQGKRPLTRQSSVAPPQRTSQKLTASVLSTREQQPPVRSSATGLFSPKGSVVAGNGQQTRGQQVKKQGVMERAASQSKRVAAGGSAQGATGGQSSLAVGATGQAKTSGRAQQQLHTPVAQKRQAGSSLVRKESKATTGAKPMSKRDSIDQTLKQSIEVKSPESLSALYMRRKADTGASKTQTQTPICKTPSTVQRNTSKSRMSKSPLVGQDSLLKKVTDIDQPPLKQSQRVLNSQASSSLTLKGAANPQGLKADQLQSTKHLTKSQSSYHTASARTKTTHPTPVVTASLGSSATPSQATATGKASEPTYLTTAKESQSHQASSRTVVKKQISKAGAGHRYNQSVEDFTSAAPVLSLMDLQIADPADGSNTSIQLRTSNPPLANSSHNDTQSTFKSATVTSIASLMADMDAKAQDLLTSTDAKPQNHHLRQIQGTTSHKAKKDGSLLDFQAAKRLQLERLIIDLRRDFEMACLEQRSTPGGADK